MYRPPEMCDPYSKYIVNHKADIWMLGCILYTIMFKKHPFLEAQKLAIINAYYNFPEIHQFSDKILDLIRLMLTPDPSNRPDINFVLNILENWSSITSIELPVLLLFLN